MKVGATFRITVDGSAQTHDTVWIYLDYHACAATRATEARRKKGVASNSEQVYGVFEVGPLTAKADHAAADHLCAYLGTGKQVARASTTFHVV